MKRYWRGLAGFAIVAAAIFSENLFGREANQAFLRLPGIDKVLHATEYFAVFAVAYWLAGSITPDRRRRLSLAAGAGLLMAVTDEFTQRLAANRNFELFDLAANLSGLTLAYVALARPVRRIAVPLAAAALAAVSYVTYDTHMHLRDYAKALQHERRYEFAIAREYYLKALEHGLRNPAIYNEIAWVSVEGDAGPPEEAVTFARMAYEAQPDNPDVLDTYGWALHHAGRSAEARPYLEQAYAKNPAIFCIHYHLGAVYAALGQRERAADHFRQQTALGGTREAPLAARALEQLGRATATSVSPRAEAR